MDFILGAIVTMVSILMGKYLNSIPVAINDTAHKAVSFFSKIVLKDRITAIRPKTKEQLEEEHNAAPH